jgi:nucleoside-diphosphate-sugar epimerase
VGGILRTFWGDRFSLVLADVREPGTTTRLDGTVEQREMGAAALGAHERFVRCDTADYDQLRAACEGVDVVVHLAADPNPAADWQSSLLPRNVIGCCERESPRRPCCARLLCSWGGSHHYGPGNNGSLPAAADNGFHAAHEAGCERIVFASSVNAINGYAQHEPTPWVTPEGVPVSIPVNPQVRANPPPRMQ